MPSSSIVVQHAGSQTFPSPFLSRVSSSRAVFLFSTSAETKDLSLGVVFVGVTQNPLFSLLFQLLFYPPSPTIESTVDILPGFGPSLSRSFLLCRRSFVPKKVHSFFFRHLLQSFQELVLQQHLDWTDDASLGYSILLPKPLPLSSPLLFLSFRFPSCCARGLSSSISIRSIFSNLSDFF